MALTIASAEYPVLDAAAYLAQLDRLAAELRPRLSPEESPERLIAVLNAFLFGEEAFIRAHDTTGAPIPETDLFGGLR